MADELKADEPTDAIRVYRTTEVNAFFNPQQQLILATFDPKSPDGRRMMIAAAMGKCESIKDHLNKTIRIAHIYAHPAQSVDEKTGLVTAWNRIVMLDGNGVAIECGSSGIAKSIGLLAMMFDNPPWNPPITCEVKVEPLKSGRQFYKLIPVLPDHDTTATRSRARGGQG